ncbi:MAG: site-specific DNA-methyltransferase [Desulfobacula sp.]|nr:site-specific DNA-methyltransferase [Desulfobacula sp.]
MADQSNFPEKMELRSMDISAGNRVKLKQSFPSVFTETRNEKGDIVESIDFEKLKAELGKFSDVFESRRERYGMDWPNKKDAMRLIQQPSVGTLKPCREESVAFDVTENMFIEGDNLEVLKLLQKAYYGKVKVICIDPPYNTGKEFIYPDNFSETLDTYLEYAGQKGRWINSQDANSKENPRHHTKWMNMMYPRLYLARNLLRDDGVIFIHIDDNEVSNLRKLCDEIFGEENFLANVVWQRAFSPKNDAKYYSENHDFILIYGKNIDQFIPGRLERTDETNSRYSNPDNDPRGVWMSGDLTVKTYSEKYDYPIKTPSGREVNPAHGSCWRISKEKLQELINDNRIWFGVEGNNVPRLKRFLSEVQEGMVPTTLWLYQDVGHNQEGRQELKELFDDKGYFDGPKPVRLLSRILQISNAGVSRESSHAPDIILDFFAGSCTTAHAVLDLNKQDNGNRQFIMVQLPESCAPDSETFKAGYKTIADIGKERIRRVIKKIEAEQAAKGKEAAGQLPGMATEKPPALDLGFKVFKLDKSNFKIWDGADPDISEEKLARQLELFVEHIDPKSSPEDVLYELLLKAGFKLTEPVKKKQLAGKTVFSVADGALLIFLEDNITRELIDAVAEAEPIQFICLDRAFKGNDQLKANAVQTFEARNQGRDKTQQIVFRTV